MVRVPHHGPLQARDMPAHPCECASVFRVTNAQ
jgi:hypothetical protein